MKSSTDSLRYYACALARARCSRHRKTRARPWTL